VEYGKLEIGHSGHLSACPKLPIRAKLLGGPETRHSALVQVAGQMAYAATYWPRALPVPTYWPRACACRASASERAKWHTALGVRMAARRALRPIFARRVKQ
jgi:hypothetical protein